MLPEREGRIAAALAKLGSGDELAFAEIVDEYQAMVFSVAYHFFYDRPLAEDIAQDVFLHLFKKLGGIQTPSHLVHWLRRVTVHRCIDHGRRRKPEVAFDQIAEPAVDSAASGLLLTEYLQKAIALLPERQRLMVVLRYQEDLDLGEISELLSVPVNTVKSTLHRALSGLRKVLTHDLGETKYVFF